MRSGDQDHLIYVANTGREGWMDGWGGDGEGELGDVEAPLRGELHARMMETLHLQSHQYENEWTQ